MYAGKIVESAPVIDLFARRVIRTRAAPGEHPRPREDFAARERAGAFAEDHRRMSRPLALRRVRFADRCPLVKDECRQREPELRQLDGGTRASACFRAEEV